ncbi:hypothetical protein Q7P37_009440 [Cladosporium fusiforme]
MAATSESSNLIDEYCALPHREKNQNGTQTILLIHGAFGDGSAWDLVTQYLSEDYHLLLPDQICHGIARNLLFGGDKYSVDLSAQLLSSLIQRRAHNGVAKIVGHSLGANVALRVASEFPHVVDGAVFVSGASGPSSPSTTSPYLPHAAWLSQRLEWLAPRPLIRTLMDGADMPRLDLSTCTLELNKAVFAPQDSRWPDPWPSSTLVVAAGKRGMLPTDDSLDAAERFAEIGRKSNDATRAVVHYGMRHPWNFQAPKLFADAVVAWFDEVEVLGGFESIK